MEWKLKMRQKKVIKLLIVYKNGISQIISLVVKDNKDLDKFKRLKFLNVINIKEVD